MAPIPPTIADPDPDILLTGRGERENKLGDLENKLGDLDAVASRVVHAGVEYSFGHPCSLAQHVLTSPKEDWRECPETFHAEIG